MEKEKLESLLIDYIDNKLNTVDRHMIEQELVRNTEAYKLYEELREVMQAMDRSARLEPSSRLKTGFDSILKEEMAVSKPTRSIFFHPAFYRVAAAIALLILGGGIGFWISKQHDQRIAAIEEKMKKQEEQVKFTRDLMAMLQNDQSASQRILGVNVAMKEEKADDEIIKVLVKTMNEDPNTNVRLAALEALSKFYQDATVRKELIKALPLQKDPVVQIELIQLMVKMKETGVVNELKNLVDDAKTMQAVKDEAYSGILKLS